MNALKGKATETINGKRYYNEYLESDIINNKAAFAIDQNEEQVDLYSIRYEDSKKRRMLATTKDEAVNEAMVILNRETVVGCEVITDKRDRRHFVIILKSTDCD